jgi:hypothetical protein
MKRAGLLGICLIASCLYTSVGVWDLFDFGILYDLIDVHYPTRYKVNIA